MRTAIGVPGAIILEDPRDDAYTVSVKALMARHPGWVEGMPVPRCHVVFCSRDGVRALNTIDLCDTHFGLGRRDGIDSLPLIQAARRKLDAMDYDSLEEDPS